MREIFKTINGFEDYEVSNKGRVRTKPRILKSPKYKGKMTDYYYFKPKIDKDGYCEVGLRNSSRVRVFMRVHRLVALTFIPNTKNHPVINHINGIKNDNRVENLEWCTISYNTRHGFDSLGRKGHNGGMNKRVYKLDRNTCEIIGEYNSLTDASESIGVRVASLTGYFKREEKGIDATCGGFKWKLVDEDVTTIENTSKDGSK